ncbi:MAG: hypothetical protein HKN09_00215 [Saprospiraceae bacterium]|nr:hypothetical protein [Saprospiraceae bacterium]
MISAIFFSILLHLPGVYSESADTWKLVKSKENLEVYVRKLDHETFKEVKVVGIVNCKISELVASIEDVPTHHTWVTRTMESKILEKFDDGHFIYYLSMDMPFPVKDRELVIEYQRAVHPQRNKVSTTSNEYQYNYPVSEDFVRIPDYFSNYVLTDLGSGQVKLEYYMKVNPGGLLPAWLVNLAVTKGPMDTMEALFDLVESGYYKDAKVRGL